MKRIPINENFFSNLGIFCHFTQNILEFHIIQEKKKGQTKPSHNPQKQKKIPILYLIKRPKI